MEGVRTAIVAGVNRHFFYGWLIVGIAGIGIFASGPGQSHTFSVFVGPIERDLDVSSGSVAFAYGLATLFAAFLLPLTGTLIDRFGARRMLGVIIVLLGLACAFFGAAANILWLGVAFGLLRFLGQGSLMLGCANIVSHWFSRSRGFAMSLMALGFALSMAVHPPLGEFLIETMGWRQAWVVLGVLTWLLMLPPILLLIHNTPEPLGLSPDGRSKEGAEGEAQGDTVEGLTLRQALREPSFYLLSFGWFAIAMLVTTLHFYQVKIVTAQGLSSDLAAELFTVSALAMVVAMPLVGRLFDRVRTRVVFAAGLVVTGANLLGITFVENAATGLGYAVLFGVNNAFSMTMFGYMWPRYFGRRHLGAIQGTGQMIGVVGASLGPLPVGLAFDLAGSPVLTLQLLALYPFLAALLALLFLRTPRAVTGHEHLE